MHARRSHVGTSFAHIRDAILVHAHREGLENIHTNFHILRGLLSGKSQGHAPMAGQSGRQRAVLLSCPLGQAPGQVLTHAWRLPLVPGQGHSGSSINLQVARC
jgi:hypothetical protein